ncbi:MAG: hypothetical protein GXP11_03395 [Gammaproteobacteria bacterium]|nr:hypothetical protein [Gammaproteobacteria bacterium]
MTEKHGAGDCPLHRPHPVSHPCPDGLAVDERWFFILNHPGNHIDHKNLQLLIKFTYQSVTVQTALWFKFWKIKQMWLKGDRNNLGLITSI